MSEQVPTITLVAKERELDGAVHEYLVAMFKPPLPKDVEARKEGDGHPPFEMVYDKSSGGTRAVVYDRGVFGWSEAEREKDFINHWQARAEKLGYDLPEPTVRRVGASATAATDEKPKG